MDSGFQALIDPLPRLYERLATQAPMSFSSLPRDLPASGVYLLSEGDSHLYAGRSRRLRSRIQGHARSGSKQNVAAFAFLLAREESGNVKASYRPESSRKALMSDPAFALMFSQAKDRIRDMDIRVVEEQDPWRQALLEIYVARASRAKYTTFDTH